MSENIKIKLSNYNKEGNLKVVVEEDALAFYDKRTNTLLHRMDNIKYNKELGKLWSRK